MFGTSILIVDRSESISVKWLFSAKYSNIIIVIFIFFGEENVYKHLWLVLFSFNEILLNFRPLNSVGFATHIHTHTHTNYFHSNHAQFDKEVNISQFISSKKNGCENTEWTTYLVLCCSTVYLFSSGIYFEWDYIHVFIFVLLVLNEYSSNEYRMHTRDVNTREKQTFARHRTSPPPPLPRHIVTSCLWRSSHSSASA